MSGIDLLFNSSIDYERTHQIALFTLLTVDEFRAALSGLTGNAEIVWEPEKQLFDLAVCGSDKYFIEIKMWSILSDSQRKRQSEFIIKSGHHGIYVLLGTSWFENSDKTVKDFVTGKTSKCGYTELINALNMLILSPAVSSNVHEFALSYRGALQKQFNTLLNASTQGKIDKNYYYSLFYKMQQLLGNLSSRIYTVNNPGGEVYILNDSDSWIDVVIFGVNVTIYIEVVNNSLCIKFHSSTNENNLKTRIRSLIRQSVHTVLDNKLKIIDAGRLGDYMTANQVEHDFSNNSLLEKSVNAFKVVHNSLPEIIKNLMQQVFEKDLAF